MPLLNGDRFMDMWLIQQGGCDLAILDEDGAAREVADWYAHRASLLGVLAARPLVMHVDSTVEHLPALRDAVALANLCRARTGAPRIDVRVRIVLASALDCAHPVTALVTPQIGERQGEPAMICKCCGSFRRRIPGWGWWSDWQLSAPDVERVGTAYPEGAVFYIHEVAT